jgi:glycine/D-amino acid oxidase-like deaminating enzyme
LLVGFQIFIHLQCTSNIHRRGRCIAYYLTRHPYYNRHLHSINIVEASKLAGGSSGKTGGLVAIWADPQCIAPLSYKLHTDLANEHKGHKDWGFRNVRCADVDAMGEAVGHATEEQNGTHFHSHAASELGNSKRPSGLDWVLQEKIESYTELGDPTNTAQVHPYLFTTQIARLAEEQGANIILGSVMRVGYNHDGSMAESVTYKANDTSHVNELPATDIVIAAGPWTRSIFPTAPIKESRNHSIVIRPSRPTSSHVLFPELHPRIPQKRIPPEIYPRPDGTIYCCGPSDTDVPLPKTSGLVEYSDDVCNTIYKDAVRSLAYILIRKDHLTVFHFRNACFRKSIA